MHPMVSGRDSHRRCRSCSSRVAPHRRSPFLLAIWLLGLAFAASPARGQTCPASIGPYKLRSDDTSVNRVSCDKEAWRKEECRLRCTYDGPGRFVSALTWYQGPRMLADRSDDEVCTSNHDKSIFNSQDRQAKVFLWGDDYAMQAGAVVARNLLQQVQDIAAPCSGASPRPHENEGEMVGRLTALSGDVWFVAPDGTRRQASENAPVGSGIRIATGRNALARITFVHSAFDPANPQGEGSLVVDVAGESELDIREALEIEARLCELRSRSNTVFGLIKGVIHSLTSGWKSNSIFSVKAGTTCVCIRGTDFVAGYDPQSSTAKFDLWDGALVLRDERGGPARNLSAQQMVMVQAGRFSPTESLSPGTWARLVSDLNRSNAKRLANNGGNSPGKTFTAGRPRFRIHSLGKDFDTEFERQPGDDGVPIDVYYYPILDSKGQQVVQDGEKLWGRFVRVPSADYKDQSQVVWWHAAWADQKDHWKLIGEKAGRVQILGEIP